MFSKHAEAVCLSSLDLFQDKDEIAELEYEAKHAEQEKEAGHPSSRKRASERDLQIQVPGLGKCLFGTRMQLSLG